jgi:predicted DNA-binding transcriptional regulator AlpA
MTKQLLKRADVLEWTGLSPDQYRKMLDAKVLRPIKLKGYKIKWFRRRDVAEALQLEPTP